RGDSRWVLVDETFREFTPRRSRAPRGEAGVWTTGTFTKAYGGDPVRVGFVTAPTEAVDPFAAYHALVTDGLADASVSAARALLRDRTAILDETRRIFLRNRALLERGLPEVLPVHAPVCFDPIQNSDGTRFARGMLRRSILVCPGLFFGVPDGVRLCLTRRSFPADLAAYTAARAHWLRRR
ncbi:MAG TPA: aminotransferase class I/II-fold pyridoxal phosphate-dependent enzyme, partial [Thermoplasmata archaeon]|nr:aminotransferase class I/II-fold pyridoxal phosphate-dependent enzyme [Thermoplasmata archaeon]